MFVRRYNPRHPGFRFSPCLPNRYGCFSNLSTSYTPNHWWFQTMSSHMGVSINLINGDTPLIIRFRLAFSLLNHPAIGLSPWRWKPDPSMGSSVKSIITKSKIACEAWTSTEVLTHGNGHISLCIYICIYTHKLSIRCILYRYQNICNRKTYEEFWPTNTWMIDALA